MSNSTVSANYGGGIYNADGAVIVHSSIVSGNDGANCSAHLVTDGGFNLENVRHTCGFQDPSTPGNSSDGDPSLQGLDNYGGPTETMALGAGSAAFNLGNCDATTYAYSGGRCISYAYEDLSAGLDRGPADFALEPGRGYAVIIGSAAR